MDEARTGRAVVGAAHPLERLVEQETFREIISLLEPEELVVASLRLEGLSDPQIGRLLGITSSAVCRRIQQARERIMERRPALEPWLKGRRQPRRKPPRNEVPPLEHGWLCRWGDDEDETIPALTTDLTTEDVAQRCGVTPQTVRRWLRQGRFPGAYRLHGGRGAHRIPQEDLAEFCRQQRQ